MTLFVYVHSYILVRLLFHIIFCLLYILCDLFYILTLLFCLVYLVFLFVFPFYHLRHSVLLLLCYSKLYVAVSNVDNLYLVPLVVYILRIVLFPSFLAFLRKFLFLVVSLDRLI